MSAVQCFSFDGAAVRTFHGSDGEPWFLAADVCAALDITNVGNATARLDDDEKGIRTVDTLGGAQQLTTVNESGLYSLILGSRKPEAKRFKKWVTAEVLPTIRKTGTYGTPPAPDPAAMLADPKAMRTLLLGYTEKVIELEAKIEADAPKVGVYERLVEASGSLNLTQAAKALNLRTRDQLIQKLVQAGWIYRKHGSHGDWLGYQDKCQQGLMVHKLSPYVDANTGETKMSEQVRFTAKGMERMARIFNAVKVLA